MKFEYEEGKEIPLYKPVRVTKTNHIIQVMSLRTENNGLGKIKKLNKNQYLVMDTGEICDYKISENRGQNTAGLKQTFKNIRNLINNNFTGDSNELHVILTYKENMTDTKRLYSDCEKFIKKLRYKFGNLDYICIVEPQGRGAWHCHILIKFHDIKEVFIPNSELAALWGNGFTKTKSLNNVDNIGAYLSAYLSDIELTSDNLHSLNSHGISPRIELKAVEDKKYIKGGRVHLYPNGMQIVRHSKGIKIPEVETMSYDKIKRIVKNATPNYSKSVVISDDDGKILNEIVYEQYNTKKLNYANIKTN